MAFNENPHLNVEAILKVDIQLLIYKIDFLSNRIDKLDNIKIKLSPYESCVYIIGEINDKLLKPSLNYQETIMEIDSNVQLSLWNNEREEFIYQEELKTLENLSAKKHYPNYCGVFRYEVNFDLLSNEDICIAIQEVQE